jgi:hypothetical protein
MESRPTSSAHRAGFGTCRSIARRDRRLWKAALRVRSVGQVSIPAVVRSPSRPAAMESRPTSSVRRAGFDTCRSIAHPGRRLWKAALLLYSVPPLDDKRKRVSGKGRGQTYKRANPRGKTTTNQPQHQHEIRNTKYAIQITPHVLRFTQYALRHTSHIPHQLFQRVVGIVAQ